MNVTGQFIPMSSWYGKRGINWHVTIATFQNDDKLQTHTILHVFDSTAQDADTSNAVLSDSMDMLHPLKPCLDTASSVQIMQDVSTVHFLYVLFHTFHQAYFVVVEEVVEDTNMKATMSVQPLILKLPLWHPR